MTRKLLLVISLLLIQPTVFAQTQDVPKLELGAEFASLVRDNFGGTKSDAGFGGRITYNLNENFALESAGYFFPERCFNCRNNGRVIEVVGGLKAGKRFNSWGVFAKARPGIVHFTEGQFDVIPTGPSPGFPFQFQTRGLTNFAADLGGVLEFYPSRRIVARFDAGDTLIHFRRLTNNFLTTDSSGDLIVLPFTTPATTTHNFQFSAGVGFRF